jgi:hypothetical protein
MKKMPVVVDVFAPIPEGWGICLSCEMLMDRAQLNQPLYERGLEALPPDWQADFQNLSNLILNLSTLYKDTILIRIYDPRSLQGMFRALRHRVHRYPTFLINGKERIYGLDRELLRRAVERAGAIRTKLEAETIS